MHKVIFTAFLAICLPTVAAQLHASESTHHTSKYAGEENRTIKSLSDSDIKELKSGAGWGLAKAAELNGVPGPAHLLELQKEINLSPNQITQLESVFDEMNAEAIVTGNELIRLEEQLEERFRTSLPDSAELDLLLQNIGKTRAHLRFIHLSAHLKTPDILSDEQIMKYNELRGYSANDPCKNIPKGHSVTMWKKHNGCE